MALIFFCFFVSFSLGDTKRLFEWFQEGRWGFEDGYVYRLEGKFQIYIVNAICALFGDMGGRIIESRATVLKSGLKSTV